MNQSNPNITANNTSFKILSSQHFPNWLNHHQISLALTTYQTSRLILLGLNSNGQLSGFERLFDGAMGLFATSDRMYLSSKYQLWQIDNVLKPGQLYNGYDKLYIPRIGYTTGNLDTHDVALDHTGQVIFVSSLLNCLATLSQRHSCIPLWKPPFISKLVNEDRCHLNGLAIVQGEPRYVTSCSQSDVIDDWRNKRRDGGCVTDVRTNEIICAELSMPHSPRFYQNRLWLLNSGRGELGYIDMANGRFEPVVFCPGFLRGLAFWKDYAIVGLSLARKENAFSGLVLDEQLRSRSADPQCGIMVIDLRTGSVAHWLRFEDIISELYDVQVLAGVRRPMALGFQTDEISKILTLELPVSP